MWVSLVHDGEANVGSPDVIVATDAGGEAVGRYDATRYGSVLRVERAPGALCHAEGLFTGVLHGTDVIAETSDCVDI